MRAFTAAKTSTFVAGTAKERGAAQQHGSAPELPQTPQVLWLLSWLGTMLGCTAMAASLCDHVWSLWEWVTYPAKPCSRTKTTPTAALSYVKSICENRILAIRIFDGTRINVFTIVIIGSSNAGACCAASLCAEENPLPIKVPPRSNRGRRCPGTSTNGERRWSPQSPPCTMATTSPKRRSVITI